MKNLNYFNLKRSGIVVLIMLMILSNFSSCKYMKMKPPPDADKTWVSDGNTCWLATAANMLAGAGYGSGTSVQDRTVSIYNQLMAHYGNISGWADAAISWWLSSAHNTWTTNPYTVVTVYGNKSPRYPWANPNGAQFIANELRRCQMVGLSITWPTNTDDPANGIIGSGGHAITAWGDNQPGSEPLTVNPTAIRVTDSDNEDGGDVQEYRYDTYTSPNPGGENEGNGWYFSYDDNHPYIKHIVTLCPTQTPAGNVNTQKVVGSYKIHQDEQTEATDLHYRVGTDVTILTYSTSINWGGTGDPVIKEKESPRTELTVDWTFKEKPVPYCSWITITTEFILPFYNSIYYHDVFFTYPKPKLKKIPDFMWEMITPKIGEKEASMPDVTGGYVLGKFDILDPEKKVVGEYRFIHEYSFNQNPEEHWLRISGTEGFSLTNFAFGHSYGYPDITELWKFENWMTYMKDLQVAMSDTNGIRVDWKGRLPYPPGEDIKGRIPKKEQKRK